MRRIEIVALAAAASGTVAIVAACSGADDDRGGSDAGSVDAVSDTAVDAAVEPGDARADTEAPKCNVLDAGFDGSADAASVVCPPGEWRDFAASTCKTCPATSVKCTSILRGELDAAADASSPTWSADFDAGTQTIRTTLADGVAQVVYASATVEFGQCFSATSVGGNTIPVPVSVEGNALVTTVPRAPLGDAGGGGSYTPCGKIAYTLVDACCTTHTVNVTLVVDQETMSTILARECPDGG